MDALQAKALLDRYLAGQATPEEIKLVQTMYNRLVQEGEWQWKDGEKEALQALMEDRLLQKIDDQTAPIRSIPRFSKYIQRLAAAAIFIGISFGTYFLIKNQRTVESAIAVVPTKADIVPGGNRAVLTLTNGSQIFLDSARNGVLAKQGSANVTKTASGKIAYSTSIEKPTEIGSNTLTTPRGGQFQLTLPDGTRVWLNSASSITYPTAFVGKDRKVEITGEAYFQVVHNVKMPFRVKANDQIIEDIGTAFNINAYPDEKSLNTTLIEGAVKVIVGQKAGDFSVILKPGQQAQLNFDGKISIIRDADIKKIMAWKNGQFRFDGDDLETAMRQISRWYDVNVVNENVKGAHLTGVISRNVNVSEVFKMLELTGVVHFKVEGKTVTVQKVN